MQAWRHTGTKASFAEASTASTASTPLITTVADGPRSSNEMLITMLVVLGIVMMAVMLSWSMRSKMARRQADRPSPRERLDQIKAAAGERGRHEAVSSEAVDAAQAIATRLDNKSARLELLLEEAEARIAQLEGAIDAARRVEAAAEEPPRASPRSAGGHAPEVVDPLSRSVYDLADSGATSVEIAQQLDEQVGKVELILALRRDKSTRQHVNKST